MAENLTIDSSSLTRSANMFGESMVAFLDTELEYIEYLRGRNGGGTGVGGLGGERGDSTQFDHAKERGRGKGLSLPFIRPRRPSKPKVKPRNKPRIGDKLKNFKNLRNSRNVTRSLNKLGLRGNQIDFYKNLRAKNIPMDAALKQAKRLNPGGNFVKNSLKYAKDMIPNRPEFLTRMNMGGDLSKAGNNFFTRGLRPGNITETASAVKQTTLKKAKNIVRPITTKIDDVAGGLLRRGDDLLTLALPAFKNFYKVGAGKFIKKIPFGIGALIDFVILTTIFGEDPGRAAFRAAGSVLGAWLGGLAGTAGGAAIGGVGAFNAGPAGAIAGGIAGDMLGGKIFDMTLGKDEGDGGGENKINKIGAEQFDSRKENFAEGGVGYGAGGSVITAPTRGMFGGSRALVGEANEAEIILPMSKIGDALSAVYREGASVMVGATVAFLGPLAGGNPAAAALLSEARRIAQITGADTDVKVNNVELPDLSGTPNTTNTTSSSTESTSDVTKMTTGGETNSQINRTTSLSGTDRWKTILPQGDPLFSSPFGPRWGKMHRGVDIGVWEDSPVHAQEDGVVEQILPKFGEYGGAVVVSHQDGTANLYGHVYDYAVEKGQKVTKGDQLAKIQYYPGKDGSNQSHLHFERFNKSGTRIDPLPYFSQGGANIPPKKETKMDSVNKGGPNLRNISSNFVNLGSQTKRNNQTLIDTPVNVSKTASTSSPQMIPIPEPYPVPVIKREYVPVEETEKQQRIVIDVFGKGAART
ncbi:MAG: hypothetical protein CMC78_03910 [Flavobacteriaceae bacterium]|nr:hypothetical protein [Flavobacteriaceae bacterium]